MHRKTLGEKAHQKKIKQPPMWLYSILMVVTKILNAHVKTKFTVKADPKSEKGSFVYIANHASRVDYLFTAPICYPKRLNFVVGYNEFFRFPTNILLRVMQVIPKKNFTPDFYCMRQIMNVIKNGGNICIMPEGMSSITGMAQPIIPGGAKMIKKLGVPVYYSKISGAYLTYTKHCLDERVGRVEVVVDRMFTTEELKALSVEEIEDRMNRLLAHDDYMWNKEAQVKFNGKGQMAKNLDTLLYMCPRCKATYQMETAGNRMKCKSCGNEIEMDEAYNIKAVGDSVCSELVTDWTIMERENAAEEVRKDNFSYEGKVKVGILPKYSPLFGDKTSIICGEGDLKLDEAGLHFTGTIEGKERTFLIKTEHLPTFGMCTDISRFYTFVDGEFIEFYPENKDVLRWDHLTEELHRAQGGLWQNTSYRHC